MQTRITIFLLLIFSFPISVFSQVPRGELIITNIANEGFLLESTSHKVLIDALFSSGYGAFAFPPKEIIGKMMNSEVPFDNIGLYLLTHYHKDHCDPELINDYLSKNPNIPFVTSKPSIVFIDGCCFGFIGKKKQFRIITPEINGCISQTINNIPVVVYGLKHLSFYKDSIDLEETMFNVGYLIDMDGIKIFHSGDIERNAFEDYLSINKIITDSIDVAFLYYGLLKSGVSDLDYMIRILHPKNIVVMHIPPKMYDDWSLKIENYKKEFPNIMFFKNPMEGTSIKTITTNK